MDQSAPENAIFGPFRVTFSKISKTVFKLVRTYELVAEIQSACESKNTLLSIAQWDLLTVK